MVWKHKNKNISENHTEKTKIHGLEFHPRDCILKDTVFSSFFFHVSALWVATKRRPAYPAGESGQVKKEPLECERPQGKRGHMEPTVSTLVLDMWRNSSQTVYPKSGTCQMQLHERDQLTTHGAEVSCSQPYTHKIMSNKTVVILSHWSLHWFLT